MSWNIRGLNSSLKQSKVKIMIARYKLVVMGVLETRLRTENMDAVWNKIQLHQWKMEHIYSMSDQGRIWVIYDPRQFNLLVLEVNLQFIHCKITMGDFTVYWTCVYGSYNHVIRREMWMKLSRIGNHLIEP